MEFIFDIFVILTMLSFVVIGVAFAWVTVLWVISSTSDFMYHRERMKEFNKSSKRKGEE